MANQTGENGVHSDEMLVQAESNGQGASPLQAAIARAIKTSGAANPSIETLAQQHLDHLCIKYEKEIEMGQVTREHMRMLTADTTGVDIGLLA